MCKKGVRTAWIELYFSLGFRNRGIVDMENRGIDSVAKAFQIKPLCCWTHLIESEIFVYVYVCA